MTHPVTKAGRLAQIAEILADPGSPIRSQEDLAARLDAMGVHVTQATLSRDLVELSAVRLRGPDGVLAYALPGEPEIGGVRPHLLSDLAPGGPSSGGPSSAPSGAPSSGGLRRPVLGRPVLRRPVLRRTASRGRAGRAGAAAGLAGRAAARPAGPGCRRTAGHRRGQRQPGRAPHPGRSGPAAGLGHRPRPLAVGPGHRRRRRHRPGHLPRPGRRRRRGRRPAAASPAPQPHQRRPVAGARPRPSHARTSIRRSPK